MLGLVGELLVDGLEIVEVGRRIRRRGRVGALELQWRKTIRDRVGTVISLIIADQLVPGLPRASRDDLHQTIKSLRGDTDASGQEEPYDLDAALFC